MAVDLPDVHAKALQHTHGYVSAIAGDRWKADSTCEGWNVRELVNHVVSGNFWAHELMEGKTIDAVGDRLDGDVLGEYPIGMYEMSMIEAREAFEQPGAMERMVAVSYGPVPGEVYCGHRFIDVLVHGWDIATSTGQDTRLPGDLVEACWEVVEPQRELLVGSGMFGSDVTVPADADRETQLLAVLGRSA